MTSILPLRRSLVCGLATAISVLYSVPACASDESTNRLDPTPISRTLTVAIEVPEKLSGSKIKPDQLTAFFDDKEQTILGTVETSTPCQVVVYFDIPLVTPDGLRAACKVLSRNAETVAGLGPVEIVLADPWPALYLEPTREVAAIREALRDVAHDAMSVGELAWFRQRYLGIPDEADRETAATQALDREVDLLTRQRQALLGWLGEQPSTVPRVVVVVQDGFDLNPRGFYAEQTGRSFLEDPRLVVSHSELARALAAEGWTALVLALGNQQQDFDDPLAPLYELARATDGQVITRSQQVVPALTTVGRRQLVTIALEGAADGEPRPLEIRHSASGAAFKGPRWASVATPTVIEAALLLTSQDERHNIWAKMSSSRRAIELLPPDAVTLVGPTRFRTISGRRRIDRVHFFLDDEEVAIDERAPFAAVIDLGPKPERRTVRVVAFSKAGRKLGEDSLGLNRLTNRFRVKITEITAFSDKGALEVEAVVDVPDGADLDRVDFFWKEEPRTSLTEPPYRVRIATKKIAPNDYVKIVARLTDGTTSETARLIAATGPKDELDVNLVELLAMVTYRHRAAVPDLDRNNFAIRHREELLPIEKFARWDDLPLELGLIIDTSHSMGPVMDKAREAGVRFFEQALRPLDSVFVVDFDTMPRLTRRLTSDKTQLLHSLEGLQPSGYTAIFDAIVFSLLQFDRDTGRKGLVVVTDGEDSASRFQPQECIQQARLQGVPIYLVVLDDPPDPNREPRQMLNLQIATQTGGKVFYVSDVDDLNRIYDRIGDELRNQYFLAFSTDSALSPEELREIRVEVDRKGVSVTTLLANQQGGG